MKKTLILVSAFVLAAGYALAQDEGTPPSQADHGKTTSDLAKNTTGGREKGAIISSAAREKSLLHVAVNVNRHVNATSNVATSSASETGITASTIGTSLKPETAGMPLTPGKPLVLPPVTAPTQGKPDGLPGGH